MTAETDLLPLPAPDYLLPLGPGHGAISMWSENTIRQIVANATAARDAKVEALRELCGMAYQLAGVHDAPEKWLDALSNAAAGRPFSTDGLLPYMPQAVCDAEAEAKALRAEVERLTFEMGCLRQQYDERTACMIVHRGSALACSAAVRAAYSEEHERAERLAEALRWAERHCPCGATYPAASLAPRWPRRTAMTDLIERLRNFEGSDALGNGDFSLLHEAAAALEAAREDAERYRWLRDRMAAEEITDETYARLALRTVGPIAKRPADSDYCDELDAAIDQARGKGGGEVEGGR